MGDYPGFPRGPNVITEVLLSERGREKSQRLEDAVLLALKMEEWGMRQGKRAASRSWKRQGISSLGLLEGMQPCR